MMKWQSCISFISEMFPVAHVTDVPVKIGKYTAKYQIFNNYHVRTRNSDYIVSSYCRL